MAFFGFGKKKEEKKTETCTCSCSCSANEARENADCCCAEAKDGICCIKVLGAGCKSCHELYENTKQAAKVVGISTEVEYITDMQKVMEYGVMRLPALVINEKVVMQGKLMKADEIEKLLQNN